MALGKKLKNLEHRFLLPKEADTDRIDTKLRDGVLTITIPYDEAKRPRAIKVG
jgi:HSP20 family molecular chaperone IbpA